MSDSQECGGFGDGPFFGGSIFETPRPTSPPNTGSYVNNGQISGFVSSGGSFTGYVMRPHEPIQFVDGRETKSA